MLRQTFLAAPRLEGIQEEDDHSGTDSNSTQNFKKILKILTFFSVLITKYQDLEIIIMNKLFIYLLKRPELSMGKISRTFFKTYQRNNSLIDISRNVR